MKRILTASALAAALVWASLGLAASSDVFHTYRVNSVATVTGETVTLGEIASPLPEMPENTWKIMAATPLWPAPSRDGAQMVIPRGKLEEALNYYLKDFALKAVLPDQLVVQRGGLVMYGEDLNRLVVEFLTQQTSALQGDVEIRDVVVPGHLFMGGVDDKLSIDPASPMDAGKVVVRLSIKGPDGKVIRSAHAQATVNVWREVPVAVRNLTPKDGPVTGELYAMERRNLALVRGKIWEGGGGPLRVRMNVPAKSVLTADMLEPVPAVLKGDLVTLKYKAKFIELSAPGKAMADAQLGGSVAVQNVQTQKQVVGRVEDGKTILVR